MRIGIIGSGDVAQSLGKGITGAGHEVILGTGHPDKLNAFQELNPAIKVGSNAEAATYGDLVILAVKGTAADEVLPELQDQLANKVVIDVTNPLVFSDNGMPGLSVGHDNSGGEIIQKLLPDSQVVKTLNIISHSHMCQPLYQQGTPIMFLAGNDRPAKLKVTHLLEELGWKEITDLGGIENSRLLEPLCLLWVQYGAVNNTWDHGFAVLKK